MENKHEFKFEPWNDTVEVTIPKLSINEPPCTNCKYWDPSYEFIQHKPNELTSNGVRLCWSNSMEEDFSCFVLKAYKETKHGL